MMEFQLVSAGGLLSPLSPEWRKLWLARPAKEQGTYVNRLVAGAAFWRDRLDDTLRQMLEEWQEPGSAEAFVDYLSDLVQQDLDADLVKMALERHEFLVFLLQQKEYAHWAVTSEFFVPCRKILVKQNKDYQYLDYSGESRKQWQMLATSVHVELEVQTIRWDSWMNYLGKNLGWMLIWGHQGTLFIDNLHMIQHSIDLLEDLYRKPDCFVMKTTLESYTYA